MAALLVLAAVVLLAVVAAVFGVDSRDGTNWSPPRDGTNWAPPHPHNR